MEYHVNESDLVLVGEFSLFVKGESLNVEPTLPGLPGSIRSVAVTAKGGLDGSIICSATPYHQFVASDMYVKRNDIVSSYDSYTSQKPFRKLKCFGSYTATIFSEKMQYSIPERYICFL